ncbi:uncharacterized protein LOC127257781 [Andrographis paniculata]|uniref:uncharacterized protein LOC127257781 n=1 Tax=Andrographis paniculata TaxID=175694 RepID=UPI0021E876E4|nr:uncharacterized protein LOC127257781 [Andrographis paniculata]
MWQLLLVGLQTNSLRHAMARHLVLIDDDATDIIQNPRSSSQRIQFLFREKKNRNERERKKKMATNSSEAAASSQAVAGPSRAASSGHASAPLDSSLGCAPSPAAVENERSNEDLIVDLRDSGHRENALAALAMRAQGSLDLARLVWFSFGTIAILLQEVLSVYPFLSPPSLTPEQSNRLCNVLTILECVAADQDTRILFVRAYIHFYLVTLLNQIGELRCFEPIRLSSLRVFNALLQVPDARVIDLLLESEVIPPCLCAMQRGNESSRKVATLILKRLLLDNMVLRHVYCKLDRCFPVWKALESVVASLLQRPLAPLLRDVITCYLRLLEDESCLALLQFLPKSLIDGTFDRCVDDAETRILLQQLLDLIQVPPIAQKDHLNNSTRYFHRLNERCSTVDTEWFKVSVVDVTWNFTVTLKGLILLIFSSWLTPLLLVVVQAHCNGFFSLVATNRTTNSCLATEKLNQFLF